MDAFGVAGGAFLATQTPISGQSFSTALRNYTVSYAVPKLLNKPLGEIGSHFAAGGLMGGFNSGRGGFNFKFNWKPMLQTATT